MYSSSPTNQLKSTLYIIDRSTLVPLSTEGGGRMRRTAPWGQAPSHNLPLMLKMKRNLGQKSHQDDHQLYIVLFITTTVGPTSGPRVRFRLLFFFLMLSPQFIRNISYKFTLNPNDRVSCLDPETH